MIIYLFYMRDQLCKAFFHVQTVCIINSIYYPKTIFFSGLFKIVATHDHGGDGEDVAVS